MKRIPLALCLAAWAAANAQAQTAPAASVTLYGLVDTGVEHVTNVGAAGSGLTRMPNITASLPSRWGLRGSEDLGGGLRAAFTLESGFGSDNGASAQGGRLFGRQAWIGLSGHWGTVSIGRQYTMMFWSLLDVDQMGPNVYGLGNFDTYLPNARADNAIAYRGTFGGFTLGATYSLGRDTVNAGPSPAGSNCPGENAADSQACREWSALLKYDTPRWGAALAVDEIRGGPGAFARLTSSALKDRRTTANAYVKLAAFKVSAGLIRRDNDGAAALSAANGQGARSDLVWIGGAYAVSPAFLLDAQVQRVDFKNGGDKSTLTALRGTYNLSKRTALYAQVAHMSNGARLNYSVSSGEPGSSPVAGGSQNGTMVGLRHAF